MQSFSLLHIHRVGCSSLCVHVYACAYVCYTCTPFLNETYSKKTEEVGHDFRGMLI